MPRLKQYTVRLDPADVAVLKKAFPQQGYNQAVRAAVHKLAKAIEQRSAGDQAPKG